MKYLIIGKSGQLTKAFQQLLAEKEEPFIALSHEEADVSNYAQLKNVFEQYKPDFVLNCSAYNNVDKAEMEYEEAFKINSIGPYNLALLSQEYGAFLVHYSTDYVFDGTKTEGLYTEEDKPNPLNKYGLSKRVGERLSLELCTNKSMLLFRTSWVFGEGTQNFIHKVLGWVKNEDVLKISADEVSVPTCSTRIALVTYEAIRQGVSGLYHLVSSGYASRYEWAKAILNVYGINRVVIPVPADTFELPAKRPSFSAMSNEKINHLLNLDIPNWMEELSTFARSKNG
ncbi:dTDP-4-dehydrorhamnose reductase [Coprothermobacter platensis]|uniref:dTDP-4-dehydrorhamnose reductase n=1 Tax=Coprothermobacter platensis TaxID=108819 RepID=UPI0003696098|nr:dTDP-4-dehydrorhamnose reductase [Coprothermobacter platensis]